MAAPAPARTIESAPITIPVEAQELRPARRTRRWLRGILALLAVCVFIDYGLSFLLRAGWLREPLTHRLEAAFGRPVQVGNFDFSLLEGPRLEADSITVAEDPRFGSEYFLRADQLAVGLRWTALLRGRVEMGTLSFTRPSLNVVRLPNGEWNLEAWLPRPGANLASQGSSAGAPVRLARIEVSDGRVDFKQGANKLPFAFVGVDGSVEQAGPGSWQINLEAQPFRAAVAVQQAGTLHFSGSVGGTSSRLRPASLQLNWTDASLSDVLRLATGQDYGVRGLLAMQLRTRSEGSGWNFSSHMQFQRLHAWDLPLRTDDPAASLNFDARWLPDASRVELTQAAIETPRSVLHASGSLGWIFAPHSSRPDFKDAHLQVETSGVQLADLLAWYRAFHPGMAEQVAARGMIGEDLTFTGWPPRIERGEIATEGIEITGGSLPLPVRMGRAALTFTRRAILLAPVDLAVGYRSNEFRLQGAKERGGRGDSSWKLVGHSDDVAPIFSAASALGFSLPPGWSLGGPAHFDLEWSGSPRPAVWRPQGTVLLNGVKVRAPFLNQEITEIHGKIAVSKLNSTIQLASASAFGTTWRGSLQRAAVGARSSRGWQFALSAADLDATEMDRWLNPQRRESLLDRMFPFLASPAEPEPIPAWLKGSGKLEIGHFAVAPFSLHQLSANASIDGRRLDLTDAKAGFYGGALRGSIRLDLSSQPDYHLKAEYRGVNLNQLAARTFSLAQLFGGTASGVLDISAKGVGREALVHSLTCGGQADVTDAEYAGMDLEESMKAGARRPGYTLFPRATAEFTCAGGRVEFSRLRLISPQKQLDASGSVDFQQRIQLHLGADALPLTSSTVGTLRPASQERPASQSQTYELTGTLNSPVIARLLKKVAAH